MVSKWPKLEFQHYGNTLDTVHLWSQIVGKIRLRCMPWLNHSWHVSLYISPSGLTTGSIPYSNGIFAMEFDFIKNLLSISNSQGESGDIPLTSGSISSFYHQVFDKLEEMNIEVSIHPAPNEIEPAIPFAEDHKDREYISSEMKKLWSGLVSTHNVFLDFRAGFIGKCSPVHLFWGAFDLAVTRFSGREAPLHQGGVPNMPLKVMQEAYSHEVSSCGLWFGNAEFPQPIFYAYCYPTPAEYPDQPIKPEGSFYQEDLGEFILPYKVVCQAEKPQKLLTEFLETTYAAAANTGNWDRNGLEFDFREFET